MFTSSVALQLVHCKYQQSVTDIEYGTWWFTRCFYFKKVEGEKSNFLMARTIQSKKKKGLMGIWPMYTACTWWFLFFKVFSPVGFHTCEDM